jgi:hypothetical protein
MASNVRKKMKKILKWIVISGCGLLILFVAALIFAIAGPRPDVVEGTERPSWIPESATEVFHRSQEGFGWWKAAEFTISEEDFRTCAASKGWNLSEAHNLSKPGFIELLRPRDRKITEADVTLIPRALVYERRASNNGGITVALDLTASRAYYTESHR